MDQITRGVVGSKIWIPTLKLVVLGFSLMGALNVYAESGVSTSANSILTSSSSDHKDHGTHNEHHPESAEPRWGSIVKSSKDIVVPVDLIKKIENEYILYQRNAKKDQTSTDAEIKSHMTRSLAEIDLTFQPLSGDPTEGSVAFKIPAGGATIDLSHVVIKEVGSFKFQLKPLHAPDKMRWFLYYIGGAKKKKIEGEEFGSGCTMWADVSGWWQNQHLKKEGTVLYAARQRYIHILSGVWVAVGVGQNELKLASFQFFDSRYPERSCQ